MIQRELEPTFLQQLLVYYPATGKLFWMERKTEWFKRDADRRTFNTKYAGREAFTALNPNGYRQGRIFGKSYYAHRVAWAIAYNGWPPKGWEIDHINGTPSDNRLSNLRLVTSSQNSLNRKVKLGNTSNYRGVTFNKQTQRWLAQVHHRGQNFFAGRYTSELEAAQAYDNMARKLHGEFANLNFPKEETA